VRGDHFITRDNASELIAGKIAVTPSRDTGEI
jgi:hypothetical protein